MLSFAGRERTYGDGDVAVIRSEGVVIPHTPTKRCRRKQGK
nr:MAG TPA: hypothetical protein [Caudoviricetes sp.]